MRKSTFADVPDYLRDRRALRDNPTADSIAGLLLAAVATVGIIMTCTDGAASYGPSRTGTDLTIVHSDGDTPEPCFEAG